VVGGARERAALDPLVQRWHVSRLPASAEARGDGREGRRLAWMRTESGFELGVDRGSSRTRLMVSSPDESTATRREMLEGRE
jgi:hypothetical protein